MKRQLKMPRAVVAEIRHLPPALKQKIRAGLQTLLASPHEGKPLREELFGLWTLRAGRYRIIYRPRPAWIEVIAIGPRATVYIDVASRAAQQ